MLKFSIRNVIGVPAAPETGSFAARIFLKFCNLLLNTLISVPPRSRKRSRIGTKCVSIVGLV